MGRIALGMGIALLLNFGLATRVAQADEERFTYCRLGKIVRTIRAESTPEGCRTVYTKAGIDRVVGSGKVWASCHKILRNVQGNLEQASWKCRDLENFEVIGSQVIEPPKEEKKEKPEESRQPSSFQPLKME